MQNVIEGLRRILFTPTIREARFRSVIGKGQFMYNAPLKGIMRR